MVSHLYPLLADSEVEPILAPQHSTDDAGFSGLHSLTVVADGAYTYLSSGLVTLLVLPVLAVALYKLGYRVAGPLIGLVTLGLFLTRIFGSPI